jgi:hypothetical protein
MAGESNPPYRITPTRMVLDTRFAGADAAASAVGRNVVQVTPVRPFASEERPRAGRIIEPASHGNGRGRASTSYVYRQSGLTNGNFTGLYAKTYEGM